MFTAYHTSTTTDTAVYTVEGTCGCATDVTCTWLPMELFAFEVVTSDAIDHIPGHDHGSTPIVRRAAQAFAGTDISLLRKFPYNGTNVAQYRTGASI